MADGNWKATQVAPELDNGVLYYSNTSQDHEDFTLTFQSLLTPATYFRAPSHSCTPEKLKQSPAYFDASRLEVSQHWATSKDGTQVPYYIVTPVDMETDGTNPTLLYGYGGFEISMRPWYNGTLGKGWMERGGVYVLANIRGGGEFEPSWHQASLKTNRNKTYEDFFAIAEDLIKTKVTSPATSASKAAVMAVSLPEWLLPSARNSSTPWSAKSPCST